MGWYQLGEFRLFSIGEISDSGRGIPPAIFDGEELGVFLLMRNGWTCELVLKDKFAWSEGGIMSTYRFRCHADRTARSLFKGGLSRG